MKTITLLFIISLFINGVFGDEVSLMKGDSVTLYTNDADIQPADDVTVIWTYKKTRIARINRKANKAPIYDDDVPDWSFKDRLKMNDRTGDLTITNIKTTDSGLYEVQILVGSKNIQKSFDVKGVINPESDQLKSVSVKDEESVTLHTDVPDIKKYDVMQWRFQGVPVAEFNKSVSKISEDERFRDKLQLDQTGSLKIKNIRTDLSGLYEVDISSRNYTIHLSFTVTVSGEVKSVSAINGDPVTINTDAPDIKTYDQILLLFGCDGKLIAEANKQNKQFTLNDRFRDRLKLNDQTGDLTITNIRNEDAGDYELKMSSSRRTIQRRFRVNVSERGLPPGAKAVIYIVISVIILLLIAAAAAAGVVIYYRLKDTRLEVYEGESVDLKTEVTDIQRDDLIEWRFNPGEPMSQIWPMFIAAVKRVLGFSKLNETLIAKINPVSKIFSTYDGGYDLFKDKLKLNPQTGDLNINDIRQKHTGVYKLKLTRDGKTTEKRFIVSVRCTMLKVDEGESVDLKTKVTDIQRDDLIEWRFNETLIAEINPANNIFSTYDDEDDLFRDKLKLNDQTGDLNINDIRWKHDGVYKLKIIRDGETSYKRFNVSVRYEKETLDVYEGESVDLKTELKDIKKDDVIEWRYEDEETLIAQINPAKNISRTYDGVDYEFKGKLKLIGQTGDLNINDITWKHDGVYLLKTIRDGKTSYKTISVSVRCETLRVEEGESVDLKTEVKDIQRDDLIEWTFGETLIAKINPVNNIFSTYDDDYGLFRDKLKLNPQTGELNINDIRQRHAGDYILRIIRDEKTSDRCFTVFVTVNVKILEVDEGKSAILKTEVPDIMRVDLLEWRFGRKETLIAKINPVKNKLEKYDVGDDDPFKDKLEQNRQTGDLNIKDFTLEHTGVYKLKITSDGETSERRFAVSIKCTELRVNEGESVNLKNKVKDIKRFEKIEWRFGDEETLIAEINPADNISSTSDKGLFRGKLKLNPQTGDLTIRDIRWENTGVYKLKIIRGRGTKDKRFRVSVSAGGDSVGIEMDPLLYTSNQ